jgi:hypothetical protein
VVGGLLSAIAVALLIALGSLHPVIFIAWQPPVL